MYRSMRLIHLHFTLHVVHPLGLVESHYSRPVASGPGWSTKGVEELKNIVNTDKKLAYVKCVLNSGLVNLCEAVREAFSNSDYKIDNW